MRFSPGCNCCGCGDVTVTVLNCAGTPQAGATVTLYDDEDAVVGSALSDSSGVVTFAIEEAGDYRAVAEKAGATTLTTYIEGECATNEVEMRLGRRIKVSVFGCGSMAMPAVTVTATASGRVYHGTTDGAGIALIAVPDNATYAIAVPAFGRYAAHNVFQSVASCAEVPLSIFLGPATGYVCCGAGDPVPKTLHLSDNAGATTLTWTSGSGFAGASEISIPQGLSPTSACSVYVGPITVRVEYVLNCSSGLLTRKATSCGSTSYSDTTFTGLRDKDDSPGNPQSVMAEFTPQSPASFSITPFSSTYAAFNKNGLNLGGTSITE